MLSDADVERLALELAKHSGLQKIDLDGTGCFVIAVWSGDVRGGGGGVVGLTFLSGNPITAAAAAHLVHHIVAHEQLKEFKIDCAALAPAPRFAPLTPLLCRQVCQRKYRVAASGCS